MDTTDTKNQQVDGETKTNLVEGTLPKSPQTPTKEVPKMFDSRLIKLAIILTGIFVLLVILLVFIQMRSQPTSVQTARAPSPPASPQSAVTIPPRQISEFGQSEEFKNFEARLFELKEDSANVDLSESELAFPLLDMKVNFDK